MTMSLQIWLQRMLTEMTLCCTQTFLWLWIFCGSPILLIDLVLFVKDSCQGLIVTGPILVPKMLMLFLLGGIMGITGYSHFQNLSQLKSVTTFGFSTAEGTLIIPEWPSAHWWPLVYQGKGCLINEVRKVFGYSPKKKRFPFSCTWVFPL